MADPKNPFDFGTGSIDKDQWLRDIDSKLEEFISMYGSAANKHRTTLLRQAFQDLRRRIATGDMLNRTADGLYQFGSALNREDKHMQEAYQRALGFMGNLARRQINTPAPEPEKKSVGSIEERWIKSLNPSGNYNKTAYWKNQTDDERRTNLVNFLNGELTKVLNHEYNDFGGFNDEKTLTDRLSSVLASLNDKKANDWTLQLLGFTKNWLQQPEEEKEEPKSELEQVKEDMAKAEEAQQVQQGRQYLNWLKYRGNPQKWEFETKPYDYQGMFDYNRKNGNIKTSYLFQTPNFGSFSFTPFLDKLVLDTNKLREGFDKQNTELITNYLKDLGVNYSTMAEQARLGAMLGMLQSSFTVGDKIATPYASQMSKYFTPMLNGAYYINGSANKETGRYAFYTPKQVGAYAPGIHEVSILDLDDPAARQAFGIVLSNRQGGIIEKFDVGGEISDQDWANYLNKVEPKTTKPSTLTETVSQDTNKEMTTGDWVNILGPTTLDITSMLSANVPGWGTLASGLTGLGSTIWSGIHDASKGLFSTAGTLASLGADVFGLVPGWGMSAKVGKISKNVLRYAKPIMYAFTARGLSDAGRVLSKGINLGFDSLDSNDWQQLAAGFTSLMGGAAKGTAAIKRSNLQEMRRASASRKTYNYIDNNGEIKSKTAGINDDTSGNLRVSRYKISADKEGVIKGRTQALEGFNAGYGIASNKRFGMLYEQAKLGDVPLHSWETWEWKTPKLFNTDKAKQQLMKLRGSQKSKTETPKAETPKTEPKPKKKATPKKKKIEAEKKQIGGILKALRNGGIIKAVKGVKLSSNAGTWYNDVFSGYGDTIINRLKGLEGKDRLAAVDWLNGMQDQHSLIYTKAGNNFNDLASGDYTTHAYQVAYNQGNGFTTEPGGFNTLGIKPHYNTRYDFGGVSRNTGDNVNQNWGPDGYYSLITDDRRILGRLDDWTPELLNTFNEKLKELGYVMDNNYDDKYYRIKPLDGATQANSPTNPNDAILQEMASKAKPGDIGGTKKVGDSEGSIDTVVETRFKDPFDPTLLSVAAKTLLGLRGNRNIYLNLLDEMPLAPLRDPIDRKLAIVGWQERIKHGQNELADLRRVQQMLRGSDQQTNFATALETERVGRDIMDKAFMEDSGRLFETAQKSWNLDNEDYLYNIKVGDDNRRAIADRARTMAQIRAAWRSGDNNILMGALADTSNWLLKKYQREQDIIDFARKEQLGTRELFIENLLLQNPNYEALKAEYEDPKTSIERKKAIAKTILEYKVEALRKAPSAWALKIYSNFHTPWFGGGYKTVLVKDGTKLEIAKLKARGRDNDRYVSMIKDLRHSRRRRRR